MEVYSPACHSTQRAKRICCLPCSVRWWKHGNHAV